MTIKEVQNEYKKIDFPDKEEVKKKTATTIAFCTALAVALWGISELVIFLIGKAMGV